MTDSVVLKVVHSGVVLGFRIPNFGPILGHRTIYFGVKGFEGTQRSRQFSK